MRKLLPAAAALLLALPACENAFVETDGPLTGTWRYRAASFQLWATQPHITCSIETVMVIRDEGGELEGRSEMADATCTSRENGTTRTWTMSQGPGVVRGDVQDGRVHFSNAGGWHSLGELHPTLIQGHLESYGGVMGQPMRTVRSGSFTLEKISDQGYDGPRA